MLGEPAMSQDLLLASRMAGDIWVLGSQPGFQPHLHHLQTQDHERVTHSKPLFLPISSLPSIHQPQQDALPDANPSSSP